MQRRRYLVLVAILAVVAITLIAGSGQTHAQAPTGAVATAQAPSVTPATCTAFLGYWRSFLSGAYDEDAWMTACSALMGIDAYCAAHNAYPAVYEGGESVADPGPRYRALVCSPNPSDDNLFQQYGQIIDGVELGLSDAMVGALPYLGPVVSGAACLSGVVFGCATLALDIAQAAGASIPGVANDAVQLADHAADCAGGDVVSCLQLGAQGAHAAGVQVPGFDVGAIADDASRCSDGDIAACVDLGDSAASAAGLSTPLTGTAVNVMDCINGSTDACVALGKEAAQAAGFPVGKLEQGIRNAQACLSGDVAACVALGRSVAVAANHVVCGNPADCALARFNLAQLAAAQKAQGAPPPRNLHLLARADGYITLGWDGSADEGAVAYLILRNGATVGTLLVPEFGGPFASVSAKAWRGNAIYSDQFSVDQAQNYTYTVCPQHRGEAVAAALANARSCASLLLRAPYTPPASTGAILSAPSAISLAGTATPQPAAYHAPSIVDGWPQLSQQTQGEAVRSLQYLLQARGAALKADGLFGPETRQAVVNFQQAQGLTTDGVVGPATWAALLVTVQQGSRGTAVQAVQGQLNSRGAALQVDGVFGAKTDASVRQFQQTRGLTVDGLVGPQTWQALLSGQ